MATQDYSTSIEIAPQERRGLATLTYRLDQPQEQGAAAPRPYISVVVPSLDGRVQPLVDALIRQSLSPDMIQVVVNVRPNGKARNQGVQSCVGFKAARIDPAGNNTNAGSPAASERPVILVFIDDDALPTSTDLLAALVQPLLEDESIGVTGCARVLPENADWFQSRVAAEIPRTVNAIPSQPLETNPPLEGYGHSLLTTTCCALRYETYQAAGGFSELLSSGVDTDFFYRVRNLGLRFLMVPDVAVTHPAPATPGELWRKFQWYGYGYAQETARRPQQRMGPRLPKRWQRWLFLAAATLWLLPNVFILYSFGYPRLELGFRPLKAFSTYAVVWGYVRGWEAEQDA
jgi:GT2 family glycosyltransferase